MEQLQKIKNRLGSIYISILAFTILKILMNGLAIYDIIMIITYTGLFVALQKKLVNLNIQCILSIIAGLLLTILYLGKNGDLMIILAIWLIIYSMLSLKKIKNSTDI